MTDPHSNNPNVHYRLYLGSNDLPTVICVQDFDYPDYDPSRFLSPAAWDSEVEALRVLVELLLVSGGAYAPTGQSFRDEALAAWLASSQLTAALTKLLHVSTLQD